MPMCGVRGCIGKHEGAPVQVGKYFVLKCDLNPSHRAWNVDQKWFWATRKPARAAEAAAPAVASEPAVGAGNGSGSERDKEVVEALGDGHGSDYEKELVAAEQEAAEREASAAAPAELNLLVGRWSASERAAAVASYLQRREPEEWTRLLKLAAADAHHLSEGSDSHDRFVPRKRRKSQSYVWQHCHLRKSTNGSQWYCNICAESRDSAHLPLGSWGKYIAGSTTNQASHLQVCHQIGRPGSGAADPAEKTSERFWSAEELQSTAKLMAKCFALDRLPPYWVERPGFNALMHGLLGPSFKTPTHGTIARHQDNMLEEIDTMLQQELSEIQLAQYPLLTLSTDLWEGCDGYHYLCIIVHYVTAAFQRRKKLLYMDKLKTSKCASDVAQRIRAVLANADIKEEWVFAAASDCTSSAQNISKLLGVQTVLCSAHVIALEPRRQLFPVQRQRAGSGRLQATPNPQP